MDAKLIRRLCLWSIGATTLVFAMALLSLFLYRRSQLMAQADRDAKCELYMASSLICDQLEIAKTAVQNSALPGSSGDSRRIVESLLCHNPHIYGTAIALEPEYAQRYYGKDRFMIYSYRTSADTLHTFLLSDSIAEYFHYTAREWYRSPIETMEEHWTEPYRDSLTSGALMVSYSYPMVMQDSTIIGILLADITLNEGINSIVSQVDAASNHRTYLLSRAGQLVFGDTAATANAVVYTQHIPETGWTLGHVIDKDILFDPLRRELLNMGLLFVLAVAILCITIRHTVSWTTRPAVKRQMRIQAELDVASRIQEGMLPQSMPPFPGRHDLDIATVMHPAKEVGGDFYNYFLEGERLYFIIGDVSGKGIPAALVMAIATELFMVSAPGEANPSDIMDKINRVLCRDNKENMFITMIVGILDIPTRKLRLCDAGHNLPILVNAGQETTLRIDTNIPTGMIGDYPFISAEFDFPVGARLMLYTDGVTEAENALREQFGAARLMQVVHDNRDGAAGQLRDAIERAIHGFTAGHEQSDDITLFILHLRKHPT